MNFMLVAYSKSAFQEFILPQTDNTNYEIVLDHGIFGSSEDIRIMLEVVTGIWRLVDLKGYQSFSPSSSLEPDQKLEVGGIIQLNQETIPITILVMTVSHSLSRMEKYHIQAPCKITIGQALDNQIQYDFHSMVSKHHAVLDIKEKKCTVYDTSTNGVFLGNARMNPTTELKFGDTINILGLQVVWLGDVMAIGSVDGSAVIDSRYLIPMEKQYEKKDSIMDEEEKEKTSPFRRSPRSLPAYYDEPIEIEGPPQKGRGQQRPFILTVGPSLTMALPMVLGVLLISRSGGSGTFMYMGVIIAVSSAVLGAMWAIINLRYSKKQNRKAEENRVQRYIGYLEKMTQLIEQRYLENKAVMEYSYPSSKVCTQYSRQTPEMWSRNTRHDDFLFVRLGIGKVPFQAPIIVPKERFQLYDDELEERPRQIKAQYEYIDEAPVGINLLEKHLVGIVGGPEKKGAYSVVRNMAVQLAACNCYTEVKMAFIYQGNSKRSHDSWSYAKWLPHVWSEDKKTRYIAADKSEQGEICFALSNIFREREENQQEFNKETIYTPHYVIFLEDISMIEGEPILRYLMDSEKNYGVSLVVMAERFEDLPNACEDIIQNNSDFSGYYNSEDSKDDWERILFDEITNEEAEAFTRNISGVEVNEPESGGEIPDTLTFLEMYGVNTIPELNVLDKWRKNRAYENMKVLIGQKAGGNDWFLDIHEKYHGPHGLVAGTTGSGKSETLQTYILSLAVNYSPDDIAFFIIDFKGGGMANLFGNLPHMAGQISNLSGNQVRRAMVSIKSENRRRQQLFSDYSVNHVDQYMRLYKNKEAVEPIPHLFIIIDEFAELKREEPEFMKELISVAQVGRSLGVHLILATQKPSGTVDNNIWSNAKFRICLRVQDRQDSNDMLHKPDAAFITRSGRGFMQVGNDELYEQFQSGWSGAEYDEALQDSTTDIVHMKTNTGKSAIVGNYAKVRRKEEQRIQWLERFAEVIIRTVDEKGLLLEEMALSQPDSIVQDIYDNLAFEGIDYRPSRNNTANLKNYLVLLGKFANVENRKDCVNKIISMSGGKGLPEYAGKTQLSAIVDYLEKTGRENGYQNRFKLWLPVLPEQLSLDNLFGYSYKRFDGEKWPDMGQDWTLEVMIGLYDNPAGQSQAPLIINLASDGHLALCGAVVSGKSTFLQTLIYSLTQRYSPEWLNIYILDFSSKSLSAFEGYCHVGGVMYEDDLEKISKLFTMVSAILRERKMMFRGGNYRQYVQVNGPVVPSIVIVIDNVANFREKTECEYDNLLISLSREGENYGIFLVIAGGGFGSIEIPNRIADNIRNVMCLEMGDKFKYSEVLRTLHLDVLPEKNIKGRGLALIGGTVLEFQTALALSAENDYARSESIIEMGKRMNLAWKGRRARPVPVIPEKPVWSDFVVLDTVQDILKIGDAIPYGYNAEDASIQTLDLNRTFCWLISGKERTGKTNLLRVLLNAGHQMGAEMTVLDLNGGVLKHSAEKVSARYITEPQDIFQYFNSLIPVFKERNSYKRELLSKGLDEEEIYSEMKKYHPIFLLIDDYSAFLDYAYNPPEGVGIISGFLENIIEKGRLHNIYLFITLNPNDISKINGKNAYIKLASSKRGIHLGGNAGSQKIFDFSRLPFAEQNRAYKAGTGLLPPEEDFERIEKVIIPNVKG